MKNRQAWMVGALVLLGLLALVGLLSQRPTPTRTARKTVSVKKLNLNPGSFFATQYSPYALNGHTASLVYGKKATIVVFMASWCKFCAYDDAYVWPKLATTSGVVVDIVDVSPYNGIGSPGPESPPWQGVDGKPHSVNRQGMIRVMQQYVHKFPLTGASIHVFVDHKGLQRWPIKSFPTSVYLDSRQKIVRVATGGLTLTQAQPLLKAALK